MNERVNECVFVCDSISTVLCCLHSGLITLTDQNEGVNVTDITDEGDEKMEGERGR